VAVINVGAATEAEMKEKKARVEDALHATRAAVEEGIVPAAASPHPRPEGAREALKLEDSDEQIGVGHRPRAIEEPIRMIAQERRRRGSIVVEKVRSRRTSPSATTRSPTRTRTSSRPASSTRPR
jgi:chaperonin GroEL